MSKLTEKYIQAKALSELEALYSREKARHHVYSCCEVRTKKEKGSKRADGLLCFEYEEMKQYTVSFEAKSHRTLYNLISYANYKRLDNHTLAFASIATLVSVTFTLYYFNLHWSLLLLIAISSFIILALLCEGILGWLDLDSHKVSDVIEQLKQYPANEQWITYSKDAYNLLAKVPSKGRKNQQQILHNMCSNNGFGLMLISKQRTEFILNPIAKKGNYLNAYCKEDEIKKYLESNGTHVYKNPCKIIQDKY